MSVSKLNTNLGQSCQLKIRYREALLGPGLVAILKNTGDRHLAVVATFYNPTLQKEENYRLDLRLN